MKIVYNFLITELTRNPDKSNVQEILKQTLAYSCNLEHYRKNFNVEEKLAHIYNFFNKKIEEYDKEKGSGIIAKNKEMPQKSPEVLTWKKLMFNTSTLEGKIFDEISNNFLGLRGKV